MFHEKKRISDCVDNRISRTSGRSCLIDDDEEKESLHAENNWVENESVTSNGLHSGKTGVQHDYDGAKKKHKKKWVQLPLDDVGLSYPNPRMPQHEQRAQKNGPSRYTSYQIFNAWKGKKGSDLFVKKTIDEKFIHKQSSSDAEELEVNSEFDASSVNGNQQEMSEEELLVLKALKESIKTHKKEEEKRHKAMLIEIASLPEDEKIGCNETDCKFGNGLDKQVELLDDAEKNLCDNNNESKSDDHVQASRKNKSLLTKRCNRNSKNSTSGTFLSDECIKFKSIDDKSRSEKLTKESFRVNTMTFNNSNNRNYSYSKNTDGRNDSLSRSKSSCLKSKNQKEECIQYKGILKNDSRKATSTCASAKTSSDSVNSFHAKEISHSHNVSFDITDGKENINPVKTLNGGFQPSEIARSQVGHDKCMVALRSDPLFESSTQDVNSGVLTENSSEFQNEHNKSPPSNISLCMQTDECSAPIQSTNTDTVNTLPGSKQKRPDEEKEEVTLSSSMGTNTAFAVRSVSLSPHPAHPYNFVNSIWHPVSPPVINESKSIPQPTVNGYDSSGKKMLLLAHDGILNQENVNPLIVDNNNDITSRNVSEVQDKNEVMFRNALSETYKVNENDFKNYTVLDYSKANSVKQSLNSSCIENTFNQLGNYGNIQAPPGFLANVGVLQQNSARPVFSSPPNSEIQHQHTNSTSFPGQISSNESRASPFVHNNVGLGTQNYNEMKEYVQQIIAQYPEIKDLIIGIDNNNNNSNSNQEIQVPQPVVLDQQVPPPQLVHQIHLPYYHQNFGTQHSSQACVVPLQLQNPQFQFQSPNGPDKVVQFHPQLPSQQMLPPLQNLMSPIQTSEPPVASLQKHNPPHIPLESLSQPTEIPIQQFPLPQFLQPQLSQSKTNLPQSTQQTLPQTMPPASQQTLPHTLSLISQQTLPQPLLPVSQQTHPQSFPQVSQQMHPQSLPLVSQQTLPPTISSVSQDSQIDYLQSQIQSLHTSQIKLQQNEPSQMLSYPFVPLPQYLQVLGFQHMHSQQQNITENVYQQHQILNVENREVSTFEANLVVNSSQSNDAMKRSPSLQDNKINTSLIDANVRTFCSDSDVVRDLENNSTCRFLQTSFIDHPEPSSCENRVNCKAIPEQQNHLLPVAVSQQQQQHQVTLLPMSVTNAPSVNDSSRVQSQLPNDYARFIPGQMVSGGTLPSHLVQQQQHQLFNSIIQSQVIRPQSRGRGRLNL